MKLIWLCFFLFTCSLFLPVPLSAQIRLTMVTETWPPFRIEMPALVTSAGGTAADAAAPDATAPAMNELGGIDIDVLRQLERRLGLTIEVRRHPWARALEMMKNGQIDIITGIAWTAERAGYMAYVPTSYYAVQPVLYVQKGKGTAIQSYSDLTGKTIGQSKNSAYFEPYNSDATLKKVNLSTETQIIQMLALGRVDMAIGTDPNISWDINRLGYGAVLEPAAYKPPAKTELFIAFSKKSPAIAYARQFDEALRQMLTDGTMEAIAKKYRYVQK